LVYLYIIIPSDKIFVLKLSRPPLFFEQEERVQVPELVPAEAASKVQRQRSTPAPHEKFRIDVAAIHTEKGNFSYTCRCCPSDCDSEAV
jgi:hypothetical protein